MDRLNESDLGALRWYLGQALVLISLGGSYSLELGAGPIVTASLVLTVLACIAPALVERIPPTVWRILPGFLLIGIVADFLLSRGDILPSLFRMVLLLTLYRALQIRTPREDLQLLLLTLFLLIVTGALSQEITFGLQMMIFAPVAMGLLFVVNLDSGETDAQEPVPGEGCFKDFRWGRFLSHLRLRMDYRTLLTGMILFLCATLMALLLFLLLPRFDIGAALPFPRLQTSSSLTGFSDRVEYGDVVSILEDDTIAMRVDVAGDDPPARPYWRMVVLDAYYDGGFMVSPRVAKEHRKRQHYLFEFNDPWNAQTSSSVWTLYLEGGVSSYLPAGDGFRSLRFQNRTSLQMHELTRVYQTAEINATTLSIQYRDMRFDGVIPNGLEDMELVGMKPLHVDTSQPDYLQDIAFPDTLLVVPRDPVSRRVLADALRRSGIGKTTGVEEFARRVSAYLREGRGYSLESRIPEGEGDALLRWVASGGPGHCELYAGAFVLIARSAGIPARLVTGFAGGDWNGYENYYMVRNRNAHAWCEILDPKRGWIRVDPTPGYAAGPESVDTALAGGRMAVDRTFKAYVDSLRILWFRRVIQFDSSDQEEMAQLVKGVGVRGLDWLGDRWRALKGVMKRDLSAAFKEGDWSGLMSDMAVPVGGLIVFGSVTYLLLRRRRRLTFEEWTRRKAGRVLVRLEQRGLPQGDGDMEAIERIRYGPVSSWPADPARFLVRMERRKISSRR